MRRGLVVGGATSLGVLWLISSLAGAVAIDAEQEDAAAPLFVPVVGPFVTIGTVKPDSASLTYLLVVDGVGQTAGLVMLVAGLAAQEDVLVRTGLAAVPEIQVAPMVDRDSVGLTVRGLTF